MKVRSLLTIRGTPPKQKRNGEFPSSKYKRVGSLRLCFRRARSPDDETFVYLASVYANAHLTMHDSKVWFYVAFLRSHC